MCKQKRLKCDEAKPACDQCVRRGRTCPGYRREIRWSTIISSVHGKTRPPPDDSHDVEPTEDAPSHANLGTTASFQHDVATSSIHSQPGAGANDWNGTLDADFWAAHCQVQDWMSIEADPTQAPGPEIEWTDWTEGAELAMSTADDINSAEAVENVHTSLITLPAAFAETPTNPSHPSALIPVRKANDLDFQFPRPNPVDLSTTLVEYWFSHVCSMWCTYDSPQNWYRSLAGDTWRHSEPVYYALQAMSASVLVDSLPHLKRTLPTLTTQAAQSIQRAVQANLTLQGVQARSLPTDVLLAVMGMGTSICWADPRQLGFWFLDQARGLLKRYGDEGDVILDATGQQTVEHFRQALTYWEMLANVVTKNYQNSLKSRRSKFKKRIKRAMSMDKPGADIDGIGAAVSSAAGQFPKSIGKSAPMHPWAGVSSEIQQVFGLVMGLCQNRCVARITDTILSTDDLCDALCDIELAHDLEKEILSFDFVSDANVPSNETGDPNAPLSHLVDTAEAYRLASLLHLYLAFSDLEVKFVRNCTSPPINNTSSWVQAPPGMPRDHALVTLTLRLVEVLKRIPVDSGARCIQPILLISAATGLRFDIPAHPTNFPVGTSSPIHRRGTMINQTAIFGTNAGLFNSNDRSPDFSNTFGSNQADADAVQLTSLTLEVSAARRFIVNRLGALQQSLPPRPIGVALALVRAVWFNYDSADENLRGMHWMNTMVNSGLQTLFG
jgi:hypothetical protein